MVAQILRICQFRGHKFVLSSGMTPHAEEQLNPCSAASNLPSLGPTYGNYWAHTLQYWNHMPLVPCSAKTEAPHNERPTYSTKESPLLDTTEKNYVQQWRPSAAKK